MLLIKTFDFGNSFFDFHNKKTPKAVAASSTKRKATENIIVLSDKEVKDKKFKQRKLSELKKVTISKRQVKPKKMVLTSEEEAHLTSEEEREELQLSDEEQYEAEPEEEHEDYQDDQYMPRDDEDEEYAYEDFE